MSRIARIAALRRDLLNFTAGEDHPVKLAKEARIARYEAMSDAEYEAHIREAMKATASRLATELLQKVR
jgi:hypothetical protein